MRLRTRARTVVTVTGVAVLTAGIVTTAALTGRDADPPRPVAGAASPTAAQSEQPAASPRPKPSISRPYAEATGRLTASPYPAGPDGWPSAASTGVPAGVRLIVRGSIKVTRPGTVVNAMDVRGEIEVVADNVTIRNSRVGNPGGMWGIIQREGYSGLTVQNSEIRGDGVRQMQYGILNQGGMITVRRADISVISNGIQTDHGLIEDSYFHDPKYFPGDHTDMIMSTGGPPARRALVGRHNTPINT